MTMVVPQVDVEQGPIRYDIQWFLLLILIVLNLFLGKPFIRFLGKVKVLPLDHILNFAMCIIFEVAEI